jgi:hypothetical protein
METTDTDLVITLSADRSRVDVEGPANDRVLEYLASLALGDHVTLDNGRNVYSIMDLATHVVKAYAVLVKQNDVEVTANYIDPFYMEWKPIPWLPTVEYRVDMNPPSVRWAHNKDYLTPGEEQIVKELARRHGYGQK